MLNPFTRFRDYLSRHYDSKNEPQQSQSREIPRWCIQDGLFPGARIEIVYTPRPLLEAVGRAAREQERKRVPLNPQYPMQTDGELRSAYDETFLDP